MGDELLDARGVRIEPGDTAIWGFGVGSSIAMAEGVVLSEGGKLFLTSSGRVKVQVVRRSRSSGSRQVIDLAPDRLVVLKPAAFGRDGQAILPPSPLPTQDDKYREGVLNSIASYEQDLASDRVPSYWGDPLDSWHAYCRKRLAHWRRELEKLDG